MSLPLLRVLSFAFAVVALACGPFRRYDAPAAIVLFNNQSLSQADVYALRPGGPQVRIGTVTAGRREALRVPDAFTASDFNIVARLIGAARGVATGPITLSRGDTIEVTLPSDARMLTVLPPRGG